MNTADLIDHWGSVLVRASAAFGASNLSAIFESPLPVIDATIQVDHWQFIG
jgi:hypothetical protein